MNTLSLLSIGLEAKARAVAQEAAQFAYPDLPLVDVPTLADALGRAPAAGTELLLLGESDQETVTRAAEASDELGFRRWAVVRFTSLHSGGSASTACVREGWSPSEIALVFRSAVRMHELERENTRLRGDLSTLGRRINHDLRSPLGGVYTACDALNEILAGQTEEHVAFTQSIATSADEVVQLLERVSLVLRASAESAVTESVPMGEVIFFTLQRLERRTLKAGATVHQPPAWPTVPGVNAWLEIIWFNLVANAVKHSGPAPHIELGWSETPGEFHFWVDDRGTGVAADKANKLFHPFHLLHRLNAPRGLGLSLVRRLVELQGGRCTYAPRDGGGAHFLFTLPKVRN